MSQPKAVLDASAVLAWLFEEKGSETVQKLAGYSVITAADLSEVLYRAAAEGYKYPVAELATLLSKAGFAVIANTPEDATVAATLIAASHKTGGHLSLGDGLCLAAGIRLDLPVVASDQEWETLDLPIKVIPFR